MNGCYVCNTEAECRLSDRKELQDLRKHLKDCVGHGDRVRVSEGLTRNYR